MAGGRGTYRTWRSVEERAAVGREARREFPRRAHAALDLPPDRDPIAILQRQEEDRVPELVPLRRTRMAASPYAFHRGAAAVMAADLASAPVTGIPVQLLGDASLSNFRYYASRQQTLVFDASNFEETLPGPWEWDLKRLAASAVLAGRENRFTPRQCWVLAQAIGRTYRERMHQFAAMGNLDVWYARIASSEISDVAEVRQDPIDSLTGKARRRDRAQALAVLSEVVDDRRRIVDNAPLVAHVEPDAAAMLEPVFDAYRRSLVSEVRELMSRYRLADACRIVLGVASVGTRRHLVLLEGRDRDDIQFMFAIEARPSILEPHLGHPSRASNGERIVAGQRLMQARPDMFLGWARSPGPGGREWYWRRVREVSGAVDIATLRIPGMTKYASLCTTALARAHARSGDPVAIAAYLGTADTFDGALADFAEAYADVVERDHATFVEALRSGRVSEASPAAAGPRAPDREGIEQEAVDAGAAEPDASGPQAGEPGNAGPVAAAGKTSSRKSAARAAARRSPAEREAAG